MEKFTQFKVHPISQEGGKGPLVTQVPSFLHHLFYFACVSMHVCIRVDTCVFRPKVDVSSLPESVSTLYIRAGSLTWIQILLIRLVSFLRGYPSSAGCVLGLQVRRYENPIFYVGTEDPHWGFYTSVVHALLTEPSSWASF